MAPVELFTAVFLHGLWFKMSYAISKDCEKVNEWKIVAPVLKVLEIYLYCEFMNKVSYKTSLNFQIIWTKIIDSVVNVLEIYIDCEFLNKVIYKILFNFQIIWTKMIDSVLFFLEIYIDC